MERREPVRPAPLVGVERVAQPVVVAIDLAAGRLDLGGGAVGGAEAPGAVAGGVELGLAGRHPLGDRLSDSAGAAEAVQREPGRHPEPGGARQRSQQGVAVGRHRVGVADERHDARVLQEREPAHGPRHELGEALVVGRERAGAVIPRDAVHPAGYRVGLVAAEEGAAGLRAPVHEIVGVAEARHVARELVAVHRLEGDVLVVDRHRRRERADHRRNLGRPDPAGVHDGLGLDRAGRRLDGAHLAARSEADTRHLRARADLDAESAGGVGEGVGGGVRVDAAVVAHPDRAVERLRAGLRHQRERLLGADHVDVEADPARPAGAAPQLHQALLAGGDPEASEPLEHAELLVELDAVAAEAHHRRRGVELGDEAGRVAGRAARQLTLLDKDDVGPPGLGQVVGDAAPGDAAADDNDSGSVTLHVRALLDQPVPTTSKQVTIVARP